MEYSLDKVLKARGARWAEIRGLALAVDYGDVAAEYGAAAGGAALYAARDRSLIQLTGRDRAAWLNNLVTNTIKTLQPGEGNYAFVLNVKGRIRFDINMIVVQEAIWLDLDQRAVATAMAHLNRYLITEDVQIRDRSNDYVRLALLGPKAGEIAAALGATQAGAMAALGSTTIPLVKRHRLMVRHDFAGVFGVELAIEAADGEACWSRLMEIGSSVGLRPCGWSAVRALRMEAGIPAWGEDINEDVLPAETRQVERAISYAKGCYLGQEVVERMRSHGALARTLVGLRLTRPLVVPAGGIAMKADGNEIGRLTSCCESPAIGGTIGLGYAKTSHAQEGQKVILGTESPVEGQVCPLPFR